MNYIVIWEDILMYQGDDLLEFMYKRFDVEYFIHDNIEIKIRPKNYTHYKNVSYTDYGYSKSNYVLEEALKDFAYDRFINYAKSFGYKIYKIEKQL